LPSQTKNQLSVLSQKKGTYSKEKDAINMCKHLEECRKILEAKLFNAGNRNMAK